MKLQSNNAVCFCSYLQISFLRYFDWRKASWIVLSASSLVYVSRNFGVISKYGEEELKPFLRAHKLDYLLSACALFSLKYSGILPPYDYLFYRRMFDREAFCFSNLHCLLIIFRL